MTTKAISKVWEFESSSGSKTYETLLYSDGTTSCNCMGWTRRTTPDGSRSCKHTRLVDMRRADAECLSVHEYGRPQDHESGPPTPTFPAHNPADFGTTKRKLALA